MKQNRKIQIPEKNLELTFYLPAEFDTLLTYKTCSDDGCEGNVIMFANKNYKPVADNSCWGKNYPDSTFQVTINYVDTSIFRLCSYSFEPKECVESFLFNYKYNSNDSVEIIKTTTNNSNISDLKSISIIGRIPTVRPYIKYIESKELQKKIKEHITYIAFKLEKTICIITFHHLGSQSKKFKVYSNKLIRGLKIKKLVTQV